MNRKYALLLALIVVCLLGIAMAIIYGGNGPMSLYHTFNSPDGRYRLEVYAYKAKRIMPGQSGDVPGIVFLKNKDGIIIKKCKVEMVQLVENPEWSISSVRVKLLFDFSF